MAAFAEVSKKLVLKYEEGSFSFSKIEQDAEPEELYALAQSLNAFQTETPERISYVTTSMLM